ncbi:Zinc ion binding isoform 2 [Theobroma cacao]|uniref:Zinc ion binding isoform 2 n=1 Tax=Theobroma cacao TaxID=3641 RepID=A0A061F5V4_THECC|nr:Zinc ion binding isoform 2 [Theobroma cacao]
MNLGDLHKVWEIKALKRKPGEEEAKKILEKIAKQVQPIMRKHKWRVKLLSEFCPNNPALLGLNVGGGVHVKLRLRRPNRDWDFYPFDQVLDTMLHELCHNAHGPHNASFYKLWDELRKECEELLAKGITGTGEGFDLPGRRLGGFSRQAPLSSLRQTALTAAENRARLGSLLPSGPKRLGGDSTIMDALSPIQAAAMAAERRLQDDIWCGSHCSEVAGDEENSADTRQDHLDMEQRAESLRVKDVSSGHALGGNSDAPVLGSFINCAARSPKSPKRGITAMWECESCTLLNPPLAPICELCCTEKPRDIGTKYKFWSCKFCTLENSVKLDKCSACDQWRYSHGPPVSTRAPNVGT